MFFSLIKLKLLQFSSNYITTHQSSLVNNHNIHHNHHGCSKNGLVQRLINPNCHYHAAAAATTTVNSIVTSSLPCRLALNIMRKFRKVSCAAMLIMCMSLRVERVPFSNRLHLVFRSLPKRFSINKTRFFADLMVEIVLKNLPEGSKVLPSTHEKTLRVASITRKLGQGMHETLGLKREFNIVAYEPDNESNPVWTVGRRRSGQALSSCDTLINGNNNIWFRRMCRSKDLEGAEWKVTVIDSPMNNAFLAPGKHIFLLTQLMNSCSDDDELACTIGHEMGHSIGRHYMDSIMMELTRYIISEVALFNKIASFVYQHLLTRHNKIKFEEIMKNYTCRRQEFEADYIGMMLMATAGYDPRVAPIEISKPENEYPDDIPDSDDIHPRGRCRATYLNNPERMKKAMCLYRDYQLRPFQ